MAGKASRLTFVLCWGGVFLADVAYATQGHSGPEGLYAHQMAHTFFAVSMGIFAYWLNRRKLVLDSGWRCVQISALFFLAWNIDAFCVHMLDEHLRLVTVTRLPGFEMELSTKGPGWLVYLYYFAKLDHVLCVPGLAFLYMGLKNLLAKDNSAPESGQEIS